MDQTARSQDSKPESLGQDLLESLASPAGEIDLRAYWRMLVNRRWVILAVFAVTVALTTFATLRQEKVFSAVATIVIDLNPPRVLDKDQVQEVVDTGTGGFWFSKEYYETQYKVITSRAVAQRVVEKMGLAGDERFLGIAGESKSKKEAIRATLDPIELLRSRLHVNPVKDSRIVQIEVEDSNPVQASRLANAVAEAYIAENLAVRTSTTQSASDWLEQQLADLELKLNQSGSQLFDFKQRNDIVSTSWEDRQSMVSQRLVSINDALTKARIEKVQLEAKMNSASALSQALSSGKDPGAVVDELGEGGELQGLASKLSDVLVECADLDSRYLPDHPRKVACEARIAAARSGLSNGIRGVVESVRRRYAEAVETERRLSKLLDEAKSEAFALNRNEQEYLELKRTYDNNQRLYELVLKRLKDTGITGMLQMSNVRILDRAQPKDIQIRPRPVRNVLLAGLLGLLAGLGIALLLEYLDTTVTTREQVEERLGVAFLGIIPSVEADSEARRELYVQENPKSAIAECVRSIRTNLLFMSPERPLKRILLTSAGPGEGKTTTAVALAATMAGSGNRVLLIDGDMRRPRLHDIFELGTQGGLSSLILGDKTFEESVRRTPIHNLDVLPCGPIPPNPTELLHTAAFSAVLDRASASYDRVIIDSPPAGVVADPVVVATKTDGTVFVLKAGRTSRDGANRAIRALQDVKARLFGAVLNNVDLEDQRYGRYYEYYRYGYYGGGEQQAPKPTA